jgi:hypothetical protein
MLFEILGYGSSGALIGSGSGELYVCQAYYGQRSDFA